MLRQSHPLMTILTILFGSGCCHCESKQFKDQFCSDCYYLCGLTDHFAVKENELFERLNLKCAIGFAAALYYFTKAGPVQSLLKQIKYEGAFLPAYWAGVKFGSSYLQIARHSQIQGLVAIPIHWKRRMLRGYNQSHVFAQGISRTTGIPVIKGILTKKYNHKSQTKEDRMSRFEHVSNSFSIRHEKQIKGKRLLLVDDVVTTGATIEAAATSLCKAGAEEVHVGTIAVAIN